MKTLKIVLALMALLPFSGVFAQVGEIIYRDFEPDSILIYWHKLGPVWIDLDADGEADDFRMQMNAGGQICYPVLLTANPNIRVCIVEPDNTDIILSEVEEENWKTCIGWIAGFGSLAIHYSHYGFRIQREEGYYYGWFETYDREVSGKNEKRIVHHGFDRTAYCTIPNYPLRWGETELVGLEETGFKASTLILRPNPATDIVHIEGVEATVVKVCNALGQLVQTVQNTNQVSLEGLPQGIYLLRITTKDGSVFSNKVVKN